MITECAYRFTCRTEGCSAWATVHAARNQAGIALSLVREAGWQVSDDGDKILCPSCSKEKGFTTYDY